MAAGADPLRNDLDSNKTSLPTALENVAKGLVSIFDSLQPWVMAADREYLSDAAIRLRQIFKKAHDPNSLIFNDLPKFAIDTELTDSDEDIEAILSTLRSGLQELLDAYPNMLEKLRRTMLGELGVPNTSETALSELRSRAENIRDVSGDFKLNAFAIRMATFAGDIEEVASLAAGKPIGMWIDTDVKRATMALAEISQAFNKAEAFAYVRGRASKRQAMAIVVSEEGKSLPKLEEFDITNAERAEVDVIVAELRSSLNSKGIKSRNIILAAIAELARSNIEEASDNNEELPVDISRETA